jgi:hypothetical protein
MQNGDEKGSADAHRTEIDSVVANNPVQQSHRSIAILEQCSGISSVDNPLSSVKCQVCDLKQAGESVPVHGENCTGVDRGKRKVAVIRGNRIDLQKAIRTWRLQLYWARLVASADNQAQDERYDVQFLNDTTSAAPLMFVSNYSKSNLFVNHPKTPVPTFVGTGFFPQPTAQISVRDMGNPTN